jgi:two-component system sensor histidine kinase KdpD
MAVRPQPCRRRSKPERLAAQFVCRNQEDVQRSHYRARRSANYNDTVDWTRVLRSQVFRCGAALAGVALVTFIASRVIPVNATTVGFAYLLLVLVFAATWGFVESLVAAIAATVAYNFFFLPPVGTLTIADPENWVALFSLLSTGVIASHLSTKARQRALEAIEHRQEVERLYTFSRGILLIEEGEAFPKQLARSLAQVFELRAVVLYDRRTGEFHRAGPAEFDGLDDQLRDSALQGTAFSDLGGGRVITAVRLGAEPIASLALQGSTMSDAVLQGVSNLVAIGLERARAQDLAHQVEVAQQSEQLRTTLIDAMAHEFKTPLTSIKAATSSLRSNPDQPPAARAELLAIADEEAEHLQQLIDDAIEMGRLDTARIEIQPTTADLSQALREEVGAMRAKADGRQLELAGASEPVEAAFDHRLFRLAIRQLLDNAFKYSPSGTPVTVKLLRKEDTAAIEIVNGGPGIAAPEQARIFRRFYRSPAVKHQVPGTGLGLSIAHSIALAHHGNLTVSSRPGETTFRLTVPRILKEAP